ncbi:MAG: hydroxymethylbilane synthase [Ferrimicrobium sp.]
MATRTVRIATRGSDLALVQARMVAREFAIACEFVVVDTYGDRDTLSTLTSIGGQGVFVKEIQRAVLDGDADVAVHSAKDLPSTTAPGLSLASTLARSDPRDALVGNTLAELPSGARVGTSSVRRSAQLQALRTDISIESIRGNIHTRLKKLEHFDAIFVAAAALVRLGIHGLVVDTIDTALLCPQVGQGTIAIECRSDDEFVVKACERISDRSTMRTLLAERAFLRRFGTGCSLPIGAYARVEADGEISLQGMVATTNGSRILRGKTRGVEPESLGVELAESLIARGALSLIS